MDKHKFFRKGPLEAATLTSTALARLAQQRFASTRLKVGLAAASVSRMAEITIRLVRMLARDTAMSATTIVPPR